MFDVELHEYECFHALEVVDHCSETQLQEG